MRVPEVLVDRDPLAQQHGVLRHDREPAAGDDAEALGRHAVDLADLGDEAQVVDLRQRGVLVASGEGDLELAGQQLRQLAAHEVAHEGARVGGDVERLVVADAGPGVAGDVAHGVAAGLARGQAGAAEHLQQLERLVERHVVVLHVLARGEVALAQRREALGDLAEGVELVRGDAAEGQLDADHLAVGLALSVDALAQPELGELQRVAVPVEELGRLGGEVGELVLEDRDHMAGGVGTDGGGHARCLLRRDLLLSTNPVNNTDNLPGHRNSRRRSVNALRAWPARAPRLPDDGCCSARLHRRRALRARDRRDRRRQRRRPGDDHGRRRAAPEGAHARRAALRVGRAPRPFAGRGAAAGGAGAPHPALDRAARELSAGPRRLPALAARACAASTPTRPRASSAPRATPTR